MNAVPPKGQMTSKGAQGPDDHIHLTMSFEEDAEAAPAQDMVEPSATGGPAEAPGGGMEVRAQSAAAGAGSRTSAGRTAGSGLLPQFAGIELSLTVEVGSLNIPLKDLVSVEPGQLLLRRTA